jgi:RNA recognition motif-containing protein
MRKRIQVGNLDESVDDRGLGRLFAPHGVVRRARVATRPHSGRSTGVGFVKMDSAQAGEAAIAALDQYEHRGHVLTVCWSRPRPGADAAGAAAATS